uniref:hypothetical protein n=1 Tax=Marinobacterium profundum TaxID=1714300 RepID=UPI000829EA56|nr:hypothetical protein [Marinobacterium profundum]
MQPLPHKTFLNARAAQPLIILTGLFALRVLAQPLSLVIDHALLPGWDSWQSGVLGYPLLLSCQLLILIVMGRVSWQLRCGLSLQRPRLGRFLLATGGIYFVAMLIRAMVGLIWLPLHPWFGKPLPTFFHLLLATWLLYLGMTHLRSTSRSSKT